MPINEICPNCGKDVCNGMGPATMPTVTMVLDKLPSAEVFYDECCQHDMDFHLQIGFVESNNKFLRGMKKKSASMSWFFQRKWYWLMAYRTYWFVTGEKGQEAYEAGACKELPNA